MARFNSALVLGTIVSSVLRISASILEANHILLSREADYTYLGCYNDGDGLIGTNNVDGIRMFLVFYDNNYSQTTDSCAAMCVGYQYFGTQYGYQCGCGDAIPSAVAANDDCTVPCAGDSTETCGGGWQYSIYEFSIASLPSSSELISVSSTMQAILPISSPFLLVTKSTRAAILILSSSSNPTSGTTSSPVFATPSAVVASNTTTPQSSSKAILSILSPPPINNTNSPPLISTFGPGFGASSPSFPNMPTSTCTVLGASMPPAHSPGVTLSNFTMSGNGFRNSDARVLALVAAGIAGFVL
ncbi:WSC-domain-containing protein [Mollisia scopiformis]|uniref:WSC-domain-containing protein n=1 Tax=Mollisia scopiformis TaxID=149040 RepID=A0A132BBV2_MOLSC|nr:WSC-domain-containing protein [Mollisia scopiformis]KUJ09895.1 WSC-domain-containing protein [Mollisia scopiformis]